MDPTTDEQQLDQFTQKNSKPVDVPIDKKQSADETVAQKAREGNTPLSTTVLQKRSVLSDSALEKQIASGLHKHVGTLNEGQLRAGVAEHLAKNKDQITEAEYARIESDLLASSEAQQTQQAQQNGSLINPPPFVSNSVQALQDRTQALADRASTWPTPGGIGLLVGALLFFVWCIVPVNGKQTRLQLLWGIVTGQVELQKKYHDAEISALTVRGGGADFNNSNTVTGGGADFNNSASTSNLSSTLASITAGYAPSFEVF